VNKSLPGSVFGQRLEAGTVDRHLRNYVADCGFRRALLITGKQSFVWFEEKNFIPSLEGEISVKRWSDFLPNPDSKELREGLTLAQKYDPDVVIGIGGGSVLDMAKLIAALMDNPSSSKDLFVSGADFDHRKVSLVLVPTTAGSGAEATHFAVLYRDGVKHSIAGKALNADYIALDSDLVKTASPEQLAASGLDALCQCIESLWSRKTTPSSLDYAEEGLTVLAQNLVAFVKGDSDSAREMQWASHLSGQAINISRTTGPHALSYHLTAEYQVPHGIAAASTVGHFIDHHNELLRSDSYGFSSALGRSMGIINRRLGLSGDRAGSIYFSMLFSQLGLTQPERYWPPSVEGRRAWLSSANSERLENHPTDLPKLGKQ